MLLKSSLIPFYRSLALLLLVSVLHLSSVTVREKRKNVTKAIAKVQQRGDNLEYVSEALKDNEKVVLAAVQRDGVSLRFASEGMKDNEKVVMVAVQQEGWSLQFASEGMKGNEKVVLTVVQETARSLQYASDSLHAKLQDIQIEFHCDASVALRSVAEPSFCIRSYQRRCGRLARLL